MRQVTGNRGEETREVEGSKFTGKVTNTVAESLAPASNLASLGARGKGNRRGNGRGGGRLVIERKKEGDRGLNRPIDGRDRRGCFPSARA